MSNVVSMTQTCDYLVRRAAARRHRGNYDEAMMLLSKAKDLYGLNEEIEIEMARVYEEIGCEEEAARAYLRVVRLGGKHKPEALFQLAISSMQRADLIRAASYYEMFLAGDQSTISPEYVQLLGKQLQQEAEKPRSVSPKAWMKRRIRRGVSCMHAGKTTAARRAFERALKMQESARIHTLLSCCALLDGDAERSIEHGQRAKAISPGRVQALLVLADAYALAGDEKRALNILYLAFLRAKDSDDYLAAALESAKRGQDALTLRATEKILRLEPFHTRAMMLRACAYMNTGKCRQAERLFARVCGLTPENTVSEALFRLAREGRMPDEPLTLGLEIPREIGVERAMQLVSALYMSREDLQSDAERARALCRTAAWAFRSQLAGNQVAMVALLVMRLMDTKASRCVLLDVLADPQIDDEMKCKVLQTLSDQEYITRVPVDIGGRLVRLAAGAQVQGEYDSSRCRDVVQRAADALAPGFRDAPKALLDIWMRYLKRYGVPSRRHAAACSAALEYVYHVNAGRQVSLRMIAGRHGARERLCACHVRRMLRLEPDDTGSV
ncbi:MAG: tetratricopeptide repeat protein [Clostridia bacterium]|nr:tetratricopeptide repeat protein [Clostridia bacterium]